MFADAHSSTMASVQAGARGGDHLPAPELGLIPKASRWTFRLKEQTIISVPSSAPLVHHLLSPARSIPSPH